jgi:hypothetical protein
MKAGNKTPAFIKNKERNTGEKVQSPITERMQK